MNAVGIIAEYNPFHNGHKWHVDAAKQQSGCPFVIAVMSGNFMQRGEPALFDKWTRASMAVKNGVDLVIELPTVFSVRSAQYFATGGIRLLHSLGIVKHVCFGAEHNDVKTLETLATAIDDEATKVVLRLHLKAGYTYAAALGKALATTCTIANAIIASPNNILAIEYLRAIQRFAPTLLPLVVQRQHAPYHATTLTAPFSSATAIRHVLLKKMSVDDEISSVIPPFSCTTITDTFETLRGPTSLQEFSTIILATLRMTTIDYLEQILDVNEGLHHKLHASALQAANLTELLAMIKSKRYTHSRLQRILIHTLLGTTKTQVKYFDEQGPLYARVLALNHNGRLLLKEINKYGTIPIITKTTQFLSSKQRSSSNLSSLQTMLSSDTLASDIYALGLPNSHWNSGGWDFRHSPLYIPPLSTITNP